MKLSLLCLSVLWAVPLVSGVVVNFQPDEVASVDGLLELTLTVTLERTLNGTRLSPMYNGGPIGPTLRVKPGDTLSVTLVNDLPPSAARELELLTYIQDPASEETEEGYINVTKIYNRLSPIGNIYEPEFGFWGFNLQNLHFHGAGFPPLVEDLFHPINGGQSKTFSYTIPDDHPPGLVWYHNHLHGNGEHIMMGGTFGMMVIEGTPIDITSIPEIGEATEVFMLMSEALYDAGSGMVAPFFPIVMAFNWSSVVNGMYAQDNTYEFTQGETVLFRAVSASVEPTIRLYWADETTGPEFLLVAEDGFPVPELQSTDVIEMPAGSRAEFMVKFDTPGTYELRRAPWNLGIIGPELCMQFFMINASSCVSYDVDMPIATITVNPQEPPLDSSLPTTVPEYSQIYADMEAQEVVNTRTLSFDQAFSYPIFQIPYDGPFIPPGTGFGIDGLLATPHHRHGEVVAGTCEEWMLVSNPPNTEHSIHSHTVPFLVTHEDGVAVEEPFWRDTYAIWGFNATIKICFNRFDPGDYLFIHCHMTTHQDLGMAAFFDVVAGDDDVTTPGMSPTAAGEIPVETPTAASTDDAGGSSPNVDGDGSADGGDEPLEPPLEESPSRAASHVMLVAWMMSAGCAMVLSL